MLYNQIICLYIFVRSVDSTAALAVKGVIAYITADDVTGNNITSDGEEVFVTKQVGFFNQNVL